MALSVGTPRGVAARVYLAVSLLASAPASYAASRPMEFGLSSSPELLQGKRFSALPKSWLIYPPRCRLTSSAGGKKRQVLQKQCLPSYGEVAYKWHHRAMASFVHPLVGDVVVNGMAAFSVGLVTYLLWLRVRESRHYKKAHRLRDRQRRSHWGYV